MMKSKNFFRLFAVMAMLCAYVGMNAQSAVHPKAYYDAITYEWTDGSNVSHTSAITEVATDPYQIVALLTKVYCDPRLPGPTYTAYDQNGNRERQVEYGAQAGGWNISASDVTAPYEDGYTILMVAVNESLSLVNTQNGTVLSSRNQLINYIRSNVKSVQLLTDGLRIGEGERAGTCFNISGTYDRFFMLGKGQSRQKYSGWIGTNTGEQPPFLHMFEQFSPTAGTSGSQITDFYSKMVGGEAYPVIHDCSSVIENEHYFSMAGKNNHVERSLTGLNIFIPDYRLKYWRDGSNDGRTMNPYNGWSHSSWEAYYAQYNQDYAPKVGIYTISLQAEAQVAAAEHTYTVNLDWTSSLNTMAGGTVGQDYTVYIVTTDEDGNEVNQELVKVTDVTHYDYTVPQDEHSYTITYVVFGQPNDGEHDMFVAWSNQSTVVIPGWNDFMALELNHYESDFDKVNQFNYYRNYLKLVNEDEVNGLTRDRVVAGENSFTLYRFDIENPDVMEPAATLTLSTQGNNVRYNIEYVNQWPRPNYNATVTTSDNVSVLSGGLLNLDNILFVDQFNASTELNDHPARYGYVLMLNSEAAAKSTNTVEVPVFKTNSTIDGYYTLQEVLDDVDAHLTTGVKNANVRFNLSTNSGVDYYTLERGSNGLPNQVISQLQRRTDGSYEEMLEVLTQYKNQEVDPGEVNRHDNLVITGVEGDYMSYMPVIWTYGEDRVKQDGDNSYGSPIWMTGVGDVNVAVSGNRSTTAYGEWVDENGMMCCIYNPIFNIEGIVPDLASIDYEPFMYRVWRLCPDVRGYGRNGADLPYNDPAADRSADKLIAEGQTNDAVVVFGDEITAELNFGAVANTNINFRIRFYYKALSGNQLRTGEAPLYYVVEKIVPWSNMPTSVIELETSSVLGKTYYNAQGIKSDKPFDGINVVVTRYSDGSVKTTKVVH